MLSITLTIVLISCLVPFVAIFLVRRTAGVTGPKQKILQTGLAGHATIMAIAPTGTVINNMNYMCRLQLRVSIPGRSPYDVEIKELLAITAMASYPAGALVAVKVDPDKPEHVVLDRSVAPGMPVPGAANLPPSGSAM